MSLPASIRAMPPHALGEDMDVPFISWVPLNVQLGTEAMAPPGALTLTPRAPSALKEKPWKSAYDGENWINMRIHKKATSQID